MFVLTGCHLFRGSPALEQVLKLDNSATTADKIGLICASLAFAFSVVLVVGLQPAFTRLWDDFGGRPSLVTQVCLTPWFPLLVAVLPVLAVGDGIVRRLDHVARFNRTIIAAVVLIGAVLLFVIGMWLPIMMIDTRIS